MEFVSSKRTWHEALDEALKAYDEEYGQQPRLAHIDGRLLPKGLEIPGIVPLEDCKPGTVILEP